MMNNRDIVVTGLQAWNISIGSNCKNIAREFARKNRVLYVNPPLDSLTFLRDPEKIKYRKNLTRDSKSGLLLHQAEDNLWVLNTDAVIKSINQLPINKLFDFVNYRNNKKFSNEINRAVSFLNFTNFIHFCDSDMFRSFHLKELIRPALSVYYTRDNLLAVKYWQRQGKRIEPKFMKKADVVLANSSYLAKLATQYTEHCYDVGQGCDISSFNADNMYETPKDIKAIPWPRIGYIGSLNSARLDISIIEYVAKKNPEWNIVLVGPEDDAFKTSNLHQYSNIYFLGRKDETELPEYLSAFDVAINPQKLNEITIGNYPRKIDEYLSMGIPSVATKTETMKIFADYVSLADNYEDWNNCIHQELYSNSYQKKIKRIELAKNHTWEKNVDEIYDRIQLVESQVK